MPHLDPSPKPKPQVIRPPKEINQFTNPGNCLGLYSEANLSKEMLAFAGPSKAWDTVVGGVIGIISDG